MWCKHFKSKLFDLRKMCRLVFGVKLSKKLFSDGISTCVAFFDRIIPQVFFAGEKTFHEKAKAKQNLVTLFTNLAQVRFFPCHSVKKRSIKCAADLEIKILRKVVSLKTQKHSTSFCSQTQTATLFSLFTLDFDSWTMNQ